MEGTITGNRINSCIRVFSALAMAAMLLVSVIVYKAPVPAVCIFIAFILFYVQLPGLLILRICRVRPEYSSVTLVIGLLSGWAFTIVLYFITDVIHTNILLYAAGPLLSAVYIAAGLRAGRKNLISDEGFVLRNIDPRGISPAFCVFAAMSLLFILLKTQYVYLAPEYCENIYMNADKAYHMGLINSLAFDYPLQSPWIQGRFISYHIFTEILYSVPVRLFDIPSDVILSSCGPLMTAYTLCLTFYAFFRSMTRRPDRAGIYCLLMLLSNFFIVRNPNSSIAFLFAYKNENTAGYGIAGLMICVLMFKEWYESRENGADTVKAGLLLAVLIMCETGIKGPMGVVLIAGIWGTWMLGLIMRKIKLRDAVPFAVFTLGFLVVYKTVLGSKGQSNSSGDSMFALATMSDISFWKKPLVEWLKNAGVPYYVNICVILLVFMMFMLTAYFLPFAIGYLRELWLVLSGKKPFDFTIIVIYAASLVGLAAMLILNYSGHSQIYFGLVTVFFAPVISYRLFEDLEDSKASGENKGRMLAVLTIVFCAVLAATIISLAGSYKANIHEAIVHADPEKTYNKYKSISNEEYEAMKWIRNNTPEDSLLATDRYYSVPLKKYSYKNRWDNRFFLYAVYAQRFCYIAGSGYNLGPNDWTIRRDMIKTNSRLYDPDYEDRGELADELGVDYVVVSKRFTDVPSLEDDDYLLCYTNDDIDIYEVD